MESLKKWKNGIVEKWGKGVMLYYSNFRFSNIPVFPFSIKFIYI